MVSLANKLEGFEPTVPQLLSLLEAARSMGEKRELDELLSYILEQSKIAMDCDRCSIFLHDRKRRKIWSRVAMGEGRIISFPEGEGIAGETIAKGQILNILDVYEDKRFNSAIDKKTGYRTKTILSIPMLNNQGVAVGCLQAINKNDGMFNDGDIQLAIAFASQAAVSIESALLYRENKVMIGELEEAQSALKQKIGQIEAIYDIETIGYNTTRLSDFFTDFSRKILLSMSANAVSTLIEWDQGKWICYVRDEEKGDATVEHQFEAGPDFDRLMTNFMDKKVFEDVKNGFETLDGCLSFEVLSRTVIPFTFVKTTQEGELVTRRGLLQICFKAEQRGSRNHHDFLEVVRLNITSIVEKILDRERQAQSNRLATIGQLSGTIFHDFKNPMASIRGLAELIGMRAGEMSVEKIEKFTGIIQTQVDRCVGMIGELLEFTRGEKNFSFDAGSLSDFLAQITNLLEIDAERAGIEIKILMEKDVTFIFDKDRLMRVIFNLVNNAMEILGDSGRITIEGKALDNGFIEIAITDSGPGVPQHLQESLFEVFVTHGKKNGTGLGLNIARQIVEGHGGVIDLDRDYKEGARFVMTLSPSPSVAS